MVHSKHRRSLLALALVMLAAFCFIALRVPYTHDDWDWGLDSAVADWLTGTYNNRYVGTFFVLTMTRFPWFKTLVMALSMTLIPILAANLSVCQDQPENRFFLWALAGAVYTSMPAVTWRESYGWVSAFANFALAALFLVLLLNLLRHAGRRTGREKIALWGLCLILSLATQLFSENLTMMLPVFLVLAALGLGLGKQGPAVRAVVAALVGSALGAVLMFYNPMYSDLAQSGTALSGIRTLTFSTSDPIPVILATLLEYFFLDRLPALYETHPAVVMLLSAGVFLAYAPRRKGLGGLLALCCAAYGLWCMYCAQQMQLTFGWRPENQLLRTGGAVMLTLAVLSAILTWKSEDKWHALFFFLFALGLAAPFAALDNLGPRCYLISHVCLLVCGLSFFSRLTLPKAAPAVACCALAATLLFHMQVYAAIGRCNDLRRELMDQARQTQAQELVLPSVERKYIYSWGYSPQGPAYADYFREFYDLPEDIRLVFLPYDSYPLWPEIPPEMYDGAMIYP